MEGDMNDKPTAAPAIWPYPHRTLEQVRMDEDAHAGRLSKWREKYAAERKSLRRPLSSRRTR